MPEPKEKKVKKEAEEEVKQKIRIKIKAFDHKIIDKSTKTIIDAVEKSNAKIFGPIPLPTEKIKYTVNRSTFIDKDARDQYEMRVHKRLIDIVEPTAKTVEDLTNLNLPAGVDVEIKMV
ncbi:MAG TPA: 30S ribosomal protein S10 [Candidatus Methylomirabilis sp.]|nr:30S ribosomal protein S10 [Candidatus Methylomirabilis sp.]